MFKIKMPWTKRKEQKKAEQEKASRAIWNARQGLAPSAISSYNSTYIDPIIPLSLIQERESTYSEPSPIFTGGGGTYDGGGSSGDWSSSSSDIAEDLDALIDRHGESGYLNLLDGESQLQNVVYVATTNYPEHLDKRFVDRPSRFDTIRYIGMPTEAARAAYLKTKIPLADDSFIQECVNQTKDFSVAYLRELVVLTQCFGFDLDKAITRLKKMHRVQPKSSAGESDGFGFLGSNA